MDYRFPNLQPKHTSHFHHVALEWLLDIAVFAGIDESNGMGGLSEMSGCFEISCGWIDPRRTRGVIPAPDSDFMSRQILRRKTLHINNLQPHQSTPKALFHRKIKPWVTSPAAADSDTCPAACDTMSRKVPPEKTASAPPLRPRKSDSPQRWNSKTPK